MMSVRAVSATAWRLRELSWEKRLILCEAAWTLALAWISLRLVAFYRIAKGLGRLNHESPAVDAAGQDTVRSHVAWAVRTASRYSPWPNTCLTEAIAGKRMLGRRGVAGTVYLGVAKDAHGKLKAHAWLRSGSRVLTGGATQGEYTVLSTFC